MLSSLFSGRSRILDGSPLYTETNGIFGGSTDSLDAYGGVSVVQTGYFTPTQNGDHTFNISSTNGSFLAINGTTIINSFTTGTVSNTIVSLVAGQPYSFVYSAPVASVNNSVNALTYSVSGGAASNIQPAQLSAPRDILSNPLINPLIGIAALGGSQTPAFVLPIANVLPTNIMANSSIATVPSPAIITATVVANNYANSQVNIIPPFNDVDVYGDGAGGFETGRNHGGRRFLPTVIDNAGNMGGSLGQGMGRGPDLTVRVPVDTGGGGTVANTPTAPTTPVVTAPTYKIVDNTAPVSVYVPPKDVTQYIPSHNLGIEVSGMIPNTRLSIFFDGVNITSQCAPCVPSAQYLNSRDPDVDFKLSGKKGDAIVTDSTGTAALLYYLPGGTYPTGAKNIAIFNYTNDYETYSQKLTNYTCSAFTTFGSTHHSSVNSPDVTVFSTVPTTTSSSANSVSGRSGGAIPGGNTVVSYTVEPMCQTFYVGSDMSQGQDGIYLSSVDVYFSAKSNTQPVTVEIRTTDSNGPTPTAIPYSTVTMPAASVVVAPSATSNSSYKTNFRFTKPVYLKAGYSYALAINPGGQSPDYSVWTATLGKTTVNGAVSSNWGRGYLYSSTTNGSTWSPIQNQFLKFAINRTQHDTAYLSGGTATIVNADYEFITVMNHSDISFQVGEYVYQKPTAHVAICSVNTTSNTLTLNTTAYGGLTTINPTPLSDFAVNDHIVICGSFPATDTDGYRRFNHNLFGNAVTLKVLSVGAGGQNLTFGYANGAAITGAPWANGACHIYKAQPGHVTYSTSSRTVVGTGTRFDLKQNTNEKDNTDKRPLIIHCANATHTHHEVLWPNNIVNSTSMVIKSVPLNPIPANSMAIPIDAPAGKVVKIDYSRNLIVLEKSTANGFTGAASAANAYATPSFFAPGRTLVGTASGATAIVSGVHDMVISSAQPVVHSTIPQGTSITYSANLTTSDYNRVTYPNYNPDGTNYFTNNQIIVASRTNEVLRLANNKSVEITATLSSNSVVLSPTIDLSVDAGLLIKTNMINSSALNEHKNNGLAKSKSVSKVVTLGDGNDAEDINVFLTAYRPLGTNLIVYAKVIHAMDSEKFEDKDWSILQQVDGEGLYSDSTDQNDYKEYRYSFPKNPVTVPSFQLLTTNNSTTIVSTNSDTLWQRKFTNGQLVTLYSDVYGTNFEVNKIATVNSNTSITMVNPVSLANTTSAIIASMPFPYSAFKNGNNGNIMRYYTSSGTAYDTFKKFAIKIVFTAQDDNLVPKVKDMRVLALSV